MTAWPSRVKPAARPRTFRERRDTFGRRCRGRKQWWRSDLPGRPSRCPRPTGRSGKRRRRSGLRAGSRSASSGRGSRRGGSPRKSSRCGRAHAMSAQQSLLEWYISTPLRSPRRARKSLPLAVPCLNLRRQAPSGERQVPTGSFEETRVTGHCGARSAAPVGVVPVLLPQPASTTPNTTTARAGRLIAEKVRPRSQPGTNPLAAG
jgi:hypothetical protein